MTVYKTGQKWHRKKWKQFVADVQKIIFGWTFNRMESYHPEHLLSTTNSWKKIKVLAFVVNFRYRFIARSPFYWKWFLSIYNSVRRIMLLKLVMHSLLADAIDGLPPNSAYADPLWLIYGCSICRKKPLLSIQDGITFCQKWIPDHTSVLPIKVSLLQRENTKTIEESFGIRMLFLKISTKNSIHDTLRNNFRLKPRQQDETFFKPCHFYLLSICLILTVFRFIGPSYTSGFIS